MLKQCKLVTNNHHVADASTHSDRLQSKHCPELSDSFLNSAEISLLEMDGRRCVPRETTLEASDMSLSYFLGSRGELLSVTTQNEVGIKSSNHATFPLKT